MSFSARTTFLFIVLALASGVALTTHAADRPSRLSQMARDELSKQYPGAKIELTGSVIAVRGSLPADVALVRVIEDTQRGEARLLIKDADTTNGSSVEATVSFAAWMPTFVAARRVLPGERLSPENFAVRDVNVAVGLARDLRGTMLPPATDLSQLESRQTILEGQFPTTTAVRRVPDIRRGDMVRIELTSGGITLSTAGVAEEPAYLDGLVRVMTNKTKRELTGKLMKGALVEVRL